MGFFWKGYGALGKEFWPWLIWDRGGSEEEVDGSWNMWSWQTAAVPLLQGDGRVPGVLQLWLFKAGFKVSSGTVRWCIGTYGTDFDNSEMEGSRDPCRGAGCPDSTACFWMLEPSSTSKGLHGVRVVSTWAQVRSSLELFWKDLALGWPLLPWVQPRAVSQGASKSCLHLTESQPPGLGLGRPSAPSKGGPS